MNPSSVDASLFPAANADIFASTGNDGSVIGTPRRQYPGKMKSSSTSPAFSRENLAVLPSSPSATNSFAAEDFGSTSLLDCLENRRRLHPAGLRVVPQKPDGPWLFCR